MNGPFELPGAELPGGDDDALIELPVPAALEPLSGREADALDFQVQLSDLLESRCRRILTQMASDLHLPVQILDPQGQSIFATGFAPGFATGFGTGTVPVPEVLRAVARPELKSLTAPAPGAGASTGEFWLIQQLLHEGDPIGVLAIGPLAKERRDAAGRDGQHFAHVLDELLGAGLEKLLASRMHTASMATAYEELQQKNMRLAAAVERLQQLDKMKSSFLATVSHELRTPLTSVIGYSEMLLEGLAGPLNEEQSEYVRTVMEKGEQLLSIISSILDISRIEAGGVRLDRAPCRLEDIVDVALSTVAPAARRKGLTMTKHLPPELRLLYADRDKVRQVLINLLSNAVKFTPEGGHVWIEAELSVLGRPSACEGEGGANDKTPAVRVIVGDSGIGIPTDALGRLFEPFFQVDSSSTREYGGTGLGLAIVKSFVLAHGGSVWVESFLGQGSRFYITLPVTP
ncbi:MAG TPA: HAMP domain-containing sensor histidine kinase [Polyangia bacterium]|jgi:signal transduction histidine kinase|nr:HAMP domain-containing sensor histidine kinase [Polyangia bacterium]